MRTSASKVITSLFRDERKNLTNETAILKDGLQTVSRTLYAAGGLHDKNLSVAYSNGESINSVDGKVVYLDSDIVLNTRKGFEDYDVRNDVLVATALVGANVKLTANGKYYDTLQEEDENIARIYKSTEFRASEMRVEHEAPGLVTYLDTRAEYYFDDELAENLNGLASEKETSSTTACALLNNVLLHRESANAVNMHVYSEAVNEALGRLERCKNSKNRHEESAEIVAWFKELFDKEPPPEEEPENPDGDEESDQDGEKESPEGSGEEQDPFQDGSGSGEQDDDEQDGDQGGSGSGSGNDSKSGKGSSPSDKAVQEANAKFDKELTSVSGQVDTETGDSKSVAATLGQPDKDGSTKPGQQAVQIGEGQPCNGWGDEVEAAGITVGPIEIGSKDKYDQIKLQVQSGTRALVNRLAWTSNQATMTEHGYRSGDVDEGSFTNLFLQDTHPAVFERTEIIERANVSVGLMIDESGSMSGAKIMQARQVAVMLTEAFRQIAGTKVRVWGHTEYRNNMAHILQYMTAQNQTPYGLANMDARSGNIDGAALWYAAQELVKHDSDSERRILFCISDGLPSGGREDGVAYNRKKAEAARKIGVEVFGIGIANAYPASVGEALFGPDAYCILSDVESAGTLIGSFITRVVNRM